MFIKILAIASMLAIWVYISLWTLSACSSVWKMRVDEGATVRHVASLVWRRIPNPVAWIRNVVRERVEPEVRFTALAGYTDMPGGPSSVTGEFLEDNKQYLLSVSNTGRSVMRDFSWAIQFPYPVAGHHVRREESCGPVQFRPAHVLTRLASGSASVTYLRPPMYPTYDLTIAELRPGGNIEILVLLNSRRARLSTADATDAVASSLLSEMGPEYRYIYGRYEVMDGDRVREQVFFAPFAVDVSRTVSLGSAGERPASLRQIEGFE